MSRCTSALVMLSYFATNLEQIEQAGVTGDHKNTMRKRGHSKLRVDLSSGRLAHRPRLMNEVKLHLAATKSCPDHCAHDQNNQRHSPLTRAARSMVMCARVTPPAGGTMPRNEHGYLDTTEPFRGNDALERQPSQASAPVLELEPALAPVKPRQPLSGSPPEGPASAGAG